MTPASAGNIKTACRFSQTEIAFLPARETFNENALFNRFGCHRFGTHFRSNHRCRAAATRGSAPGGGRGQGAAPVAGQQPAAARGATAPPPITWPSPPLPAGPIVLDTGIQHQIRLFVTKGLNQPWSMAFLPDGAILVSERPGRLRIVRNGILDPTPVAGLPQVQAQGLAGLMDLALHPRFDENKFVYFTYHKPAAPPCRRRSPHRTRRWWHPRSHHARPRTLGRSIAYRSARPLFCHSQRQCLTNSFRKGRHDLHDRRCRRSAGCDTGTDPNSLAGKVLRLRDDGASRPTILLWAAQDTVPNLHHGASQSPGTGPESRYRRNLGMRRRTERRR